MPRKKASKRWGKNKAKKAAVDQTIAAVPLAAATVGDINSDDVDNNTVGEDSIAEVFPSPATTSIPSVTTTTTTETVETSQPDLEDTATESPSTMEPEPSPSLDGEHSKDGSESEVMHTGFMQMGPKTYRCGSVIIDMDKADEETTFHFKPKDVAIEVECGGNKAMMYLSKLYQGSKGKCIEFGDGWITPNEFQTMSGRESAKDWKRSIRHRGRSLKLLLSKGILVVHPAACRCDGCLLLQQANGKTPSVDGLSGDEGKKKKSKSSSSKKKKKGKEKTKDRDKARTSINKDGSNSTAKTELNGDVPGLASANNITANNQDKDNSSSVDSSASSTDDDNLSEESEVEEQKEKKKKKARSGSDEPAPKGIKMKINLATSTAKTQSSSSEESSSGESSDDSDDSSDDEDDTTADAPLVIDPASLNSPLFPDSPKLTEETTVTRSKPPLVTTIKKPPVIVINPRSPEVKKDEESSSEDDEPLANINRTKQTPAKQDKDEEFAEVVSENVNGAEDKEPENEVRVEEAVKKDKMETEESQDEKAVVMDFDFPLPLTVPKKEEVPTVGADAATEAQPDNPSVSGDVEMRDDSEKKCTLGEVKTEVAANDANGPKVEVKKDEDDKKTADITAAGECLQKPALSPVTQSYSSNFLSTITPNLITLDNYKDVNQYKKEEDVSKTEITTSFESALLPLQLSLHPSRAEEKSQPQQEEQPASKEGQESDNDKDIQPLAGDLSAKEESNCGAMDLSEAKLPTSEQLPIEDAAAEAPSSETSGGSGRSSAEPVQSKNIPAVPPLVPVAKVEKKSGGKLSRLSNIIDNLRVTKEKQSLEGCEEGSDLATPECKASPTLPASSSKTPAVPPQLLSSRPEDKRLSSGSSSSFTPPPASHRRSSPIPPASTHTPQHSSSSSASTSRQRHSPSPSHHSRKPSSTLPSSTASSHHPHPYGSSTSSSHLPYFSGSSSSTKTSSSSTKPSTSSSHHSSSTPSTSRPTASTPSTFASIPSMLSTSPSAVSVAAASPLMAGAGTALTRHQQEQLALSLQQMMSGRMMPGDLNSQLIAYQMAQAEAAAMQLQQASYMQKMTADMQKMSAAASLSAAQSKAERDYQLAAMSALLPWPPRPDMLSPFGPFAHHHLLAFQQQQHQQQQMQQQMREKELEKEKLRQQQKQKEREQQQKRERERAEREREQQKLRQEHMDRKMQQQKLQEQQQQFRQKMMVEQQRKIDAAHSQLMQRDAKRSYEAMMISLPGLAGLAGLAGTPSAHGEQPRQAHSHSDAKKPRTSFPSSSSSSTTPGKPRPSHTKENGSGGSSSGGSRSGSSAAPNPLNLPMPVPMSPMASHGIWSNCFPHSLPAPPSLDMTQITKFYEEASRKAAAEANRAASSSASSTPSRPAAHSGSNSTTTTTSRNAHGPPSSTATSSSSSGSAGADVLDLSVSKR